MANFPSRPVLIVDDEEHILTGFSAELKYNGIKNIITGLEGGMYVTSTGLEKGNDERIRQGWEMLERNELTRQLENVRIRTALECFEYFEDLPDDWVCPQCEASKDEFQRA